MVLRNDVELQELTWRGHQDKLLNSTVISYKISNTVWHHLGKAHAHAIIYIYSIERYLEKYIPNSNGTYRKLGGNWTEGPKGIAKKGL